jgi:hypothetical protein
VNLLNLSWTSGATAHDGAGHILDMLGGGGRGEHSEGDLLIQRLDKRTFLPAAIYNFRLVHVV